MGHSISGCQTWHRGRSAYSPSASLEETGVAVEYPKSWPTLAVAAQLVATRDWEEFRKRLILKAGMLPLLTQLRANPKNTDGKLRK